MGTISLLGKLFPLWKVILVFACIQYSSSYRLNVPRVLLPYHPTIPVKFLLEVTQPTGGCFVWRSTRPDVVSVMPIGVRPGECSDKAEIRATAKAVSAELSAVIFAEDSASGTMLSCGVTVDQISRIRVETTTKILFVDAAPARMIIEAFNAEGDKFSTLSEIPIDWELSHSGDGRPLRIVPFEQSTYEAPPEIITLENNKKKGYIILVEGVLTGSATLTARFAEPHFSNIESHSLELTVVAHLLLLPAHDLYLPVHAVVPFQVQIVKQSSTEVVPMPSSAYFLQVDSNTVCSLDKATSSIRALARGRTDIHLFSQNVDVKAKTGVRPPSTAINVVDPETIQWMISGGGNWLLQTGTLYKFSVLLLDPHGNTMYISDNLRFESVIPSEFFDISHSSKNGTYFEATPKKVGRAVLKSKFVAVVDQNGENRETTGKVTGEQSVQIVDPVRIAPSQVMLPYLPRRRTSFALKATGGSGLYDWSVADTTICSVDTNGLLSGASPGATTVTVSDKRNPAHKDVVEVSVLDVISLTFGETRKEAEVGTDLVLNVQLMGSGLLNSVPFTDCRAADFRVLSSDNGVFKPVPEAVPTLPMMGTGCSTVTLRAMSSGDAKVTVSFGKYEATLDVSAYEPLKVLSNDLALGLGSSASVRFEGGPRPWLLDSSSHYSEASSVKHVTSSVFDDVLNVKCGSEDGSSTVILQVGNKPSSTLPLPALSTVEVSVCCARPGRLVISSVNGNLPKCPSNVRILLNDASMKLTLKAHALCGKGGERPLDSITGFDIKWSTANKSAIKIETTAADKTSATIRGQGTSGNIMVAAEILEQGKIRSRVALRATFDVRLVQPMQMEPSKLVLWNEVAALGTVKLIHGSGHFVVHDLPGAPFTASLKGDSVTVTPRSQGTGSLRVQDVCIGDDFLDIPVKITDIHSLIVYGPQFMEVGSEAEVTVDAVDEAGSSFSRDHGALSNAVLESTEANVHISKISGARYRVRALSVGGVSLKAKSPSASGRTLASRPHTIQVFSPLTLLPQKLTLIPESTFQLEVIGGPQPTPPIDFALNNSKIASVESNALITSKNLGYTSITGTVNIGGGHSTQSTVVLRVVSLAGIRALASTQMTETGSRIWVRVNGLDDAETPFAFGGALYPFKVTWTVSHPGVLKIVHPFGPSISEVDDNRFAISLEGASAGTAIVKVRVELAPHAKDHFIRSKREFEDSVEVRVEEPLSMRQPKLPIPSIRLAQNTQMRLETAWPPSVVEFSVPPEYASRLSVTKAGIVQAKSLAGPAVVVVRRTDSSDNETSVIPVTICAVNSLDVLLSTEIEPVSVTPLQHLPVGVKIALQVVFRDSRGRQLSASSSSISYRPHRFDLTEIVSADANRTLTITMKSPGDTVLMIWNTAIPSQNVFVRLSAVEQLYPSQRRPVVSDIVCFESPLAGTMRWSASDDRIEWLDVEQGVARLSQHGSTHVTVNVADQKLTSSMFIRAAEQLQFVNDHPKFVTNEEGATFEFPVNVAANGTDPSASAMTGCSESQLEGLSSLRAPFECIASFTNGKIGPAVNILSTRAVFSPRTRMYSCVIEQQEAGYVRLDVVNAPQMELKLTAKWLGDSQIPPAVTSTTFHMAMRVLDSEVQLSDVDHKSAVISVQVPSYQLRQVTISGCAGDIVTVSDTRQPAGSNGAANKFFLVKLNIKSAALWSDLSQKCSVTIENSVTGQIVHVPVRIRIVGQAAKQVYNALDSANFFEFVLIFLQHYSWIIPSLMWLCALGIITIAIYWFIRRRIWEKEGTFNDTTLRSNMSTSQLSRPSMSVQSSPSFFRQSPLGKSTPIFGDSTATGMKARPMGARGEPSLWSTDSTRRI
nr:Bacterial Ig domain containing protein [Haemonchus contortus]